PTIHTWRLISSLRLPNEPRIGRAPDPEPRAWRNEAESATVNCTGVGEDAVMWGGDAKCRFACINQESVDPRRCRTTLAGQDFGNGIILAVILLFGASSALVRAEPPALFRAGLVDPVKLLPAPAALDTDEMKAELQTVLRAQEARTDKEIKCA